jgi:photosystem II stability/assembly factor-like uncharacterized protein
MYTSSQHLFKTTDAGKRWTIISPDLTLADPKTLKDSGGPITQDQNGPEIYATIFSVAPSRLEEGTIWTGSDDGLAYITRDGGKAWTKITPEGLPQFSRISMIDASWHKPGTAYLAANRYQMDDRGPYIYKTDDYGAHWTKIVTGIPADDFVRVVREDRVRPGLLYAGTEHSIYVSNDDGAHWKSLAYNLPDTQVADIDVEKHDLVIATHGRSFYILDNMDWLRQTTPATMKASVHLFEPAPATRNVAEAAIDYYLEKPVEKVTVEILDPASKVIVSFSSPAPGKREAPAEDAGERRSGPRPPTDKAGMNRFTWDLHYPAAYSFPGMVLWSASRSGPTAVPGTYHVRLIAGGTTETQDIQVMADPRVQGTTPEDLQKQFDLASKINNQLAEANSIVDEIRQIRTQVEDRLKQNPDPALKSQADALLTQQKTIEETIYQTQNRSDQDPLNFPIRLNNYIGALERVVDGGDAAPTAQDYVVEDELTVRLDAQKKAFADSVSGNLAQLNATLKAKKLKSVAFTPPQPTI